MKPEELSKVLEKHQLWLGGEEGGEKANLSGATLSKANLLGANLSWATLSEANLSGAILSEANLSRANLYAADLSRADLYRAHLSRADLYRANLSGTHLSRANLSGAILSEANLSRADLYRADLYGADLSKATLPDFQLCPEESSLIAWKKLRSENGSTVIAKLEIPADAERTSSLVGRKCRASKVLVLEGEGYSPTCSPNRKLYYKEGEVVTADSFDPDIRVECSHGIHFFMTKKEAEEWE